MRQIKDDILQDAIRTAIQLNYQNIWLKKVIACECIAILMLAVVVTMLVCV